MFGQNFVKDKCPIVVTLLAVLTFTCFSIAFLIVILVNNQLLDDGIFMTYHIGSLKSETMRIGFGSPAIVCLVASVSYSVLAMLSFNEKWINKVRLCCDVVDVLFIPQLLCALVMLNDFLQIVLSTCLYAIFKLLIYEMKSSVVEYISILVKLSALIAIVSVLFLYLTGWIFNHKHVKRGGGITQLITLSQLGYDVYRVRMIGQNIPHEFTIQMAMRAIVLLCVFVEEF